MAQASGLNLVGFSGEVYVMAPGGAWMRAGSAIPLGQGYAIRTGERSKATLRFDDGTRLYLEEGTTIDLTGLQRPGGKSTLSVIIELVKGAIYADVTKRDGTRFDVDCQVSVAGVKGTSFSVYYDDARREAAVKVVEGIVEVSDLSGEKVNLKAGEMMTVKTSGLGQVEPFDAAGETAGWVPSGGCASALVLAAMLLSAARAA